MTEAEAYETLEAWLWPEGPRCPHCGHDVAYFIAPENGVDRCTRTGFRSQRRVWKCKRCRMQFSVLTGTPLQGTKIPIATWAAILSDPDVTTTPVRRLAARYGVTTRTALKVRHMIEAAA